MFTNITGFQAFHSDIVKPDAATIEAEIKSQIDQFLIDNAQNLVHGITIQMAAGIGSVGCSLVIAYSSPGIAVNQAKYLQSYVFVRKGSDINDVNAQVDPLLGAAMSSDPNRTFISGAVSLAHEEGTSDYYAARILLTTL